MQQIQANNGKNLFGNRRDLEKHQIAKLRIGTWNVNYAYEKRIAALTQRIADNEADIWILTETHDDLKPVACGYAAHSAPRPKNNNVGVRPGSRWVTVWSRYPIRQHNCHLKDQDRTVAGFVDLGMAGQLLVYGTVLPWRGDRQPGWKEHDRVIAEQCAEWLELRERYPSTLLCVAGDFNSGMETDRIYGNRRRYGTKEGALALKGGLAACRSYCVTEPSNFPNGLLETLPIDHIALPIEWSCKRPVVSAWPSEKNLSDHSGLVVEIDL